MNRLWKHMVAMLMCAAVLLAFGGCKEGASADETTAPEVDGIVAFSLVIQTDTVCSQYGTVEVPENNAIDGQTRLLEKAAFDLAAEMDLSGNRILIPSGYFADIADILEKHQLGEKYAASKADHTEGYYGMGAKPEIQEADSEKDGLVILVTYANGETIRIDTKKPSQIEAMKALVDDLIHYHDSMF